MKRLFIYFSILFFSSAGLSQAKVSLKSSNRISTTAKVTLGLSYTAALYAASQSSNGVSSLNAFHVFTLILPGTFLRLTNENPTLGNYLTTAGLSMIAVNAASMYIDKMEPNTLFAANAVLAIAFYAYMPSNTWKNYSIAVLPQYNSDRSILTESVLVTYNF